MKGRIRGVGLIELLIGMVIGLFIVGGVFAVYLNSKDNFNMNAMVSRMQEEARVGLHILSEDMELAGFLGRNNLPFNIDGRADSANPLPVLLNVVGGRPDCYPLWYANVTVPVEGTNNTNPYTATCMQTFLGGYQAGTDMLSIRHASSAPADPSSDPAAIYIATNLSRGTLFSGTTGTPTLGGLQDVRLWEAHHYYIRPFQSTISDNIPTLRRLRLQPWSGTPALRDEEIIANVEDLQVQFGQDDDSNGSIDRWINPQTVADSDLHVRAVRFWLLVRSPTPLPAPLPSRTYTYADVSRTYNDGYLRVLMERTVEIRNQQKD